MATGRIREQDRRVYVDGYNVSGYSRTIGPLAYELEEIDLTANMSDTVRGYLTGHPQINVGTLNAVFDNTATTGAHAVLNTLVGTKRTVLVAQGIRAAPAMGDPVFGGQFIQTGYLAADAGGAAIVTAPFAGWAVDASLQPATRPWGVLLEPGVTARTAVNTAVGVDDNGAATALGGYFVYHILAGDGTVTVKVQDAATNSDGSFADLTGATSGVVDASTVKHGIVAPTTLTVRRYLRHQFVFGTATTVTAVLAFVRA